MTIERWTLHHADVLAQLRELADESIDAIFCDPPYGLGPKQPTGEELVAYITGAGDLDTGGDFMGHGWSIPAVEVWREALRVLKPGGWLMAFGGSRTLDLIALGIRVAGFEVKDTLEWIYSKAMPKPLGTSDRFIDAHFGAEQKTVGARATHYPDSPSGYGSVSAKGGVRDGGIWKPSSGEVATGRAIKEPATPEAKRYAAHGQALKPGHEPIILARKPLIGTIAENLLLHDVCALNIGACRLGTDYSGPRDGETSADRQYTSDVGDGFVKSTPGPIETTTWLASLTLPPPRPEPTRTMLVLYAGTCSEMIGAVRAGWDRVIGIERDPVFVEIGEARLKRWSEIPADVDPLKAPPEKVDPRQKGLFE